MDWMKPKLESRLPGEISIISDMQMTPPSVESVEELKSLLMKVKSESEVTQSCPTLSDPMDCSLPGCSVYEILQARVLEWGAIAFSDDTI